jgi:hypothetical protein
MSPTTWLVTLASLLAFGEPDLVRQRKDQDPFRQLEEILPTPNEQRTASGAPGQRYWQQRADYRIRVSLDEDQKRITGREEIRYHNESPDELQYLWLQLDANIFHPGSLSARSSNVPEIGNVSFTALSRWLAREAFDGSVKVAAVRGADGKPLKFTIVDTMMRIDLPKPLASKRSFDFEVEWSFVLAEQKVVGGRAGWEGFPDGNALFEVAQWFPRLVAYTDVNGWQHKQFLGAGEFTLELGNYHVEIDVPADHVVASTGELRNAKAVLTKAQRERLAKAKDARKPVFIVTPEEAKEAEKERSKARKTWIFEAENVRDFAFASSRKFIWDAMGHREAPIEAGPLRRKKQGDLVLAMSFYPNEAEPLWSKFSTKSIAHTLAVYSRYTFDYPYPVAISVNGPVGGMEYPMISFNGPRPESDGTYSKRTKYGLISVVIHEVGHNYFPMIVNSDERQWTWMDEGINTFLQYLAEQEWERDYPSRRGEPAYMTDYMLSDDQVSIMTASDSLLQFGNNAYGKPATALNVLRETVLGRELFDFAFKEYARRWRFKRPQPADFFRTMEDASGVDLDWFWRGWFYSTDHVDLGIRGVRLFEMEPKDPEVVKGEQRREREERRKSLSEERNENLPRLQDRDPEIEDFYNTWDPLAVTKSDREAYGRLLKDLTPAEKKLLQDKRKFWIVDLVNEGGVVMPVILELHFADGSKQELRLPAEFWRYDWEHASKLVITEKEVVRVVLDPRRETADAISDNDEWPPKVRPTRFQLYKDQAREPNEMQKARAEAERSGDDKGGSASAAPANPSASATSTSGGAR